MLYVGDDRRSQGRPLLASFDLYSRTCQRPARLPRSPRARPYSSDRADVSRQRLGLSVHRPDGRRRSDHADGPSRRTGRDRTVQERTRDAVRRCADRVVGRARRAGCEQRSLARPQTRRHRRLGDAAFALRRPRAARHRGRSRLGNDRDVADRHGQLACIGTREQPGAPARGAVQSRALCADCPMAID